MKPTAVILAVLAFPSICAAATLNVPTQYPTIQAAIDAALIGDTVVVEPGTYVENINFLGKAITVKSAAGPEATVIDGGCPFDPDFGSVVHFICLRSGASFNWGTGMIDADPLFVDPGTGDLHLPYDSPCRDAGDGVGGSQR